MNDHVDLEEMAQFNDKVDNIKKGIMNLNKMKFNQIDAKEAKN